VEVKVVTGSVAGPVPPDTVAHRIGGSQVENLGLDPREKSLDPPGFSVLLGGTPQEAADQMRRAYPRATDLHTKAGTVGSATAASIRLAGFDVIRVPSRNLPNHGRVIHPQGVTGFSDANLARLAQCFQDTTGC
jgi:hypothetical protein